jgi:hypothetical protein
MDRPLATNLDPSFILRSRREVNTMDATNSRFVNYWQNDSPQRTMFEPSANDMNPTSSRLYREDLNRSQPYVNPSESVERVKAIQQLNADISECLQKIQNLQIQTQTPTIIQQLNEQGVLYRSLVIQLKNAKNNALAQNPYFDKYDIATDSRNVIRELRGAVSEGVTDRGLVESQKLFEREMENRWTQPDNISAFELLRPKFNNMENNYLK